VVESRRRGAVGQGSGGLNDHEICDQLLPLYNEDEDRPDGRRHFRNAIGASDGVVIVTPEYITAFPAC
jgi:chromate reductase